MLNTQQTQTNTEYNTTFTEEQFAQLEALTHKWNARCKGDYEDTFVGGVAHAYCDSGIMTDGLSAGDVDRLSKYFTSETIHSAEVDIEQLEQWITLLEGRTWETDMYTFVTAVNAVLTDTQHKHEDGATEAALAYCWQCCD